MGDFLFSSSDSFPENKYATASFKKIKVALSKMGFITK